LPLAAEGEFALVRQLLETALTTPAEWIGDHDLYAMLADVAVRQRDVAALAHYAPRAEELAVRYGHGLYEAIAHRAWGVAHRLVGEYTEAEARLERAIELLRALDAFWQIGRTLYELGELSVAQAHTAAAWEYFTEAVTAFERVRAAPDALRARTALAALV
jgi:tetratricopeptide (TPR) repeat protein